MIADSAFSIQIASSEPDPKIAVELGYMILLDKPLIVVVPEWVEISKHLLKAADYVMPFNTDSATFVIALHRGAGLSTGTGPTPETGGVMHDIGHSCSPASPSASSFCGFFFALAGYRRGCRSDAGASGSSMVDLLALNIQSAQLIDRTQMVVNGDSIPGGPERNVRPRDLLWRTRTTRRGET